MPSSAAARWRGSRGRPQVYAHRGARVRAPENTLTAFELARREGADGIELDVRLDGDDELVVIHDPTLARMTGGSDARAVAALPTRELCSVDLGHGARVPRLVEVLAWARDVGLRVNVELKADVRRRERLLLGALSAIQLTGSADFVLLSSFDPGLVLGALHRAPGLAAAALVAPPRGALERGAPTRHAARALARFRLRGVHPLAVHPHFSLVTSDLLLSVRARGLVLNAWTVNAAGDLARLAELGVDGLITDDPAVALRTLEPAY
jgi:glycerophosphoryl diester phosphodiesterase